MGSPPGVEVKRGLSLRLVLCLMRVSAAIKMGSVERKFSPSMMTLAPG